MTVVTPVAPEYQHHSFLDADRLLQRVFDLFLRICIRGIEILLLRCRVQNSPLARYRLASPSNVIGDLFDRGLQSRVELYTSLEILLGLNVSPVIQERQAASCVRFGIGSINLDCL